MKVLVRTTYVHFFIRIGQFVQFTKKFSVCFLQFLNPCFQLKRKRYSFKRNWKYNILLEGMHIGRGTYNILTLNKCIREGLVVFAEIAGLTVVLLFTLSKFKTWVIKDYKANGGEASPLCGHQHHHHYTCMSELLVIQWKYTYLIQYN